ncbi:CBS domain-containing protein [Jatrophihabitans sp. DSM 45814]
MTETNAPQPTSAATTVAQVMRPPVITIEPNAHVGAAAYLMKHAGATALVVVDDEKSKRPLGIVTETDIVRMVADGQDVDEVRIRDLMTKSLTVRRETTNLGDAARTMMDGRFRHLPIVEDGTVVGMVEIGDVLAALVGTSKS